MTFKPRRSEGFTVIATLDPLVASKEDIQTAIDLFDGVIEIYEKAMTERTRRFLLVKKLYARRYSENEPMLDRRQALLEHNHDKVAARVLLGVVSSVG